jgi:hypothetical protein
VNKFQLLVLAGVGFTIAPSIFLPYPAQAKGLNDYSQSKAREVLLASSFENRWFYDILAFEERPRCQGDPPQCKKLYRRSIDEAFTLPELNDQVFSKPTRPKEKGGASLHDDSHINQVDISERLAQVDSDQALDDSFKVYERPRHRGTSGGGR